ncbi:MAG: hypothetical protein NTX71_04045 [Candidatus Aureabacteria bacterium]|nr:hypothetical protein [Candidatus Auribacterota bacterium]
MRRLGKFLADLLDNLFAHIKLMQEGLSVSDISPDTVDGCKAAGEPLEPSGGHGLSLDRFADDHDPS